EYPAALAEALEQAGVGEQLEMARDARLALPEHLGELGHGPLPLSADGEQAQTAGIRRGAQAGQEGVEGFGGCRHLSTRVDQHMYILLYRHVNRNHSRWRDSGRYRQKKRRPRTTAQGGGGVFDRLALRGDGQGTGGRIAARTEEPAHHGVLDEAANLVWVKAQAD